MDCNYTRELYFQFTYLSYNPINSLKYTDNLISYKRASYTYTHKLYLQFMQFSCSLINSLEYTNDLIGYIRTNYIYNSHIGRVVSSII